MQDTDSPVATKVPAWFWIVGFVALLWNVLGLLAFVVSFLTPVEQMSEDPKVQRLFKNLPLWYHVVFGVAVIAGTLGCVGLLMRARWALPVLVVSILGVVAQQSYMYFMSDTLEVMGGSAAIMPTMVLVIGIALIGFSKLATGKGWLR